VAARDADTTWRLPGDSLAEQAVARGLADQGELDDLAVGWRHWATHPDGWFAILNAEVLCSVT
jgi:hypothetical protein